MHRSLFVYLLDGYGNERRKMDECNCSGAKPLLHSETIIKFIEFRFELQKHVYKFRIEMYT